MQAVNSSDKSPQPENTLMRHVRVLSRLWSRRVSGFLLFNVLYGIVFASYFAQFYRFSLAQEYTPHFSLILLIVLYLMHTRRQTLSGQATYCGRGGSLCVLVGILCYIVALELRLALRPSDFMALATFGVVIVWVGGFVAFFGLPATRTALLPLGFLVFIIPLPEALLFSIITALQYASAAVVALLLQLCALPFTREGVHFTLPGLQIEVARECSSIRSSMALCIACVLTNHLLLRCWWSKGVVWLLIFPLAVLKNGVRIVTLCLLTLYVDPGFMHSDLHHQGGMVFFGLSLALLWPILLLLRRVESRHAVLRQEPRPFL